MGDRKSAVDFYNQAISAHGDKDNPDRLKLSYALFSSACMVDSTWPDSYYQAGNNNSDIGGTLIHVLPAAIACWRRALENNPDPSMRAKLYANLGWRLHNTARTAEALTCLEEAVKLDPNLHLAWVSLSCLYQTLGQRDDMVRAAKMGYALKPDDPLAEMQLAFALLFDRQLEEGFKHNEIRFKYKLKSYLQFPYPKWKGEPGKTVYLVADQGLGDTLSFARFIPELCRRAKYVHALIQPEFLRLFNNAFVGRCPNLNLIPQPAPFPPADTWSTFVSLPNALGLSADEIRHAPNIDLPKFFIPRNWKVPDRKLHVGIAWAGSPLNDIDKHRNIPLHHFAELYRVPGIQLYSLQVGDRAKELNEHGYGPVIYDLTPNLRDIADTMAMLEHLDLVITCESALGHICAAVGKECWIPYSRLGKDYRLGCLGEDRLWSPQHRVFNQGLDCKWEPVFAEIVEALREKVDERSRNTGDSPRQARQAGL